MTNSISCLAFVWLSLNDQPWVCFQGQEILSHWGILGWRRSWLRLTWWRISSTIQWFSMRHWFCLTHWLQGRVLVPGEKVLLCMVWPEATGDNILCLCWWPACMASTVKRRWLIPSSISLVMGVTSWNRWVNDHQSSWFLFSIARPTVFPVWGSEHPTACT